MTFKPARWLAPDHHVTAEFCLRRQSHRHNAADYEAVMQSRQQLQSWSDSAWPEDDFTLEQNLADLAMHIGEHERDEAYGSAYSMPTKPCFSGRYT